MDTPVRHTLKTGDQVAQGVPCHLDRLPRVLDNGHRRWSRGEPNGQGGQVDDVVEIVELSLDLLDLTPHQGDLVVDT